MGMSVKEKRSFRWTGEINLEMGMMKRMSVNLCNYGKDVGSTIFFFSINGSMILRGR